MMRKHLLNCICLAILNCFLAANGFGQPTVYKEDNRIIKYERDIIQYLVKKKNIDGTIPFDLKDFDLKINVAKCLEIYSDPSRLLIKFSLSSDHSPAFWGVLSYNEKYFFGNLDDIGDPDVLSFKKNCDPITFSIIDLYCYLNPEEDFGYIPKASWVYGKNLTAIRDALHNKAGLSPAKIDSAVHFLINITKIRPRVYKDNDGNYHLTQEDYVQWLNWARENGRRLYWDDKEKKVRVR